MTLAAKCLRCVMLVRLFKDGADDGGDGTTLLGLVSDEGLERKVNDEMTPEICSTWGILVERSEAITKKCSPQRR